ncbi:glyoxalase superfamily protein [Rhizobium sp.]|jgi:hypothetical protein|uniref:glyoxalase superfamily protein n=1 Tax=Rhizobium sp. TaxID=391 RepID=UPI000E8E70D2|nr:hypothetical protein [Rhizobium sp.]
MSQSLPTIAEAKAQAKILRAKLGEDGVTIAHSKSLELLAQQYGYHDWNTFFAMMGNRPDVVWNVGDRVRGHYLGHSFTAEIMAVERQTEGWFRLALELDEAMDVVTFDSFSNFRKRIRGVVGPYGTSREKTSDGQPQLRVMKK